MKTLNLIIAFFFAEYASANVRGRIRYLEYLRKLLLGRGYTTGIFALYPFVYILFARKIGCDLRGLSFFEKLKYKSHSHILSVKGLLEVAGSFVIIDLDAYLVDSRKGVKHRGVFLCESHFLFGENIAVLKSFILISV